MQIIWRGVTRFHDWFDKPRTIPRLMLSQAQQAGLIGSVEWVEVEPDNERKKVEYSEDILERLLDHQPKRGELYGIAAGGSKPLPWQMTLGLFPFNKELGQVKGYNILNFWFESERFPGPEGSDALVEAFRKIHTPDNTEFAFIHPYKRWSELSDNLRGRYGNPVTASPMFGGVYWATFLGRGHMAFFDLSKLRDIKSYQVDWMGDYGLFVRMSRDIADSITPAVENEMFTLTERFRTALR